MNFCIVKLGLTLHLVEHSCYSRVAENTLSNFSLHCLWSGPQADLPPTPGPTVAKSTASAANKLLSARGESTSM